MQKQSFFYVRMHNGQIHRKGDSSCSLGHTIPRGQGEKPDGIYAQWQWDNERFTLVNDRYGFFPIYYYWHEGILCVSSSLSSILKQVCNHEFDYPALAVFLRLGFFLDNNTPFKYIKAVPPDASFIWEKGNLTVKEDIRIYSPKEITLPQAIEQYIHLFRQAIQRRLPEGEFVSLLSGGRDSRYILLELDRLGYRPKFCLTTLRYPPYEDDDIEKASLVTKSLNMKHIVKYHTKSRLQNEIKSFRMCNFCSDEHTWIMDSLDEVNENSIIYDGIAGDITALCSEHPTHLDLMQQGRWDELTGKMFKIWGMAEESTFKHTLDPDFYKKISLESAKESLIYELKRHMSATNPANSFYFWNRTRREVALCPYSVLNVSKVYSPYLDHDFADFLWSLPYELTKDRDLQSQVIERMYPSCAHIAFDVQKGTRKDTDKHYSEMRKDLGIHWLKEIKIYSKVLNMPFLMPRLLRCLADPNYNKSLSWTAPLLLLYLSELEKEAL